MKYDIDRELRRAARQKIPENIKLLPLMNAILSLSKCRSDEKVKVSKHQTPGYGDAKLKTLVIEPARYNGKLPCMVFFHGGAFILKASHAHYQIARMYAERMPCKVIYTDYRLAPKYRFPVPAEDCYRTYQWALDNAAMLHIDPDSVIIAGDSAGGNLALAVTLMARDRGIQLPNAAMLIYPVADRHMETASMQKFTDTPIWNASLSKMMWKAYLGEQQPEEVAYASPIEAESFLDFPPTYIEIAQFDALHDEGVLLYEKLQKQGIEAELHEIRGSCHGFETALRSNLLSDCMNRRIAWLKNIIGS